MRNIFVGLLIVCLAAISGCKKDSAEVTAACSEFCGKLVTQMSRSYYFDLSALGKDGVRSECEKDCSQVVKEQTEWGAGDMEKCVGCIADKGFNQVADSPQDYCDEDNEDEDYLTNEDDWNLGSLPADIDGPDEDPACDSKCDRDDIDYNDHDNLLVALFLEQFQADFAQAWSDSEPPCYEEDDDCSRDYYDGADLCCRESNPCDIISSDGNCQCDDMCSWDYGDCNGESDVDSDVDSDADSDADSDSDSDTDSELCDDAEYTTCTEDYSTCYTDCGADTACVEDCTADWCDCAIAAGCDAYVEGYC